MASRGYVAKKERETQKEIADANRQQSDINSKRDLAGSIIGAGGRVLSSVIKPVGKAGPVKTAVKYMLQDPSWYNKWLNKELFSSFPKYRNYINNLGSLDVLQSNMSNASSLVPWSTSPYVISLLYCSRIGSSNANSNYNYLEYPANSMWVKVLNELAKVNSRSVNQDSDVLGLYVLATAEIVKVLAWMKTNLEITDEFNPEQSKLRDALLLSRCNGDTTVANLFVQEKAQLRKIYNIYAKRFNDELPCISDMAIYSRRYWVSAAVIKDHAMNKAQYITFNPRSFLVLNVDADGLNPIGISAFNTLLLFEQSLDTMFTRIATDVDMQTLIGNIRAAVPESAFHKVDEVCADSLAFIDADHNALHQFHNLTTAPQIVFTNANATQITDFEKVTSDGETLAQGNKLLSSGWGAYTHPDYEAFIADYNYNSEKSAALDFYTDDVSADLINEASRLHTLMRPSGSTTNANAPYYHSAGGIEVFAGGTEFIYRADVYYFDTSLLAFSQVSLYSYMPFASYDATVTAASIRASLAQTAKAITFASRIDWMFKISLGYPQDLATDATRTTNCVRLWEISRTIDYSFMDLGKVNTMCLMSLYYTNPKVYSKKLVG